MATMTLPRSATQRLALHRVDQSKGLYNRCPLHTTDAYRKRMHVGQCLTHLTLSMLVSGNIVITVIPRKTFHFRDVG